MQRAILIGLLVLLGMVGMLVSSTPAFAAPQAICVSTTGGGDWATPATWQFCTSGTTPSATHDVYLQGPVTLAGSTSAANVTIDTAGSLSTGANTLTLAGNLTNDGTLTTPNIAFGGSATQSIGGANAITFNNLTINNAAGVALNRNVTVNGALALSAGDLNTGSNTLDLASGATVTASGGDVVGNVRRAHAFSTGTNYTFNNESTLVNFSTLTTAPTFITINLAKSTPAGLTRALPRTYSITADGAPIFTGTLQLHYATSEVAPAGLVEANMRALKQVNGRWVLQTGSVTTGGTNPYVSATNVASFSLWAITDNGAPTAVTLSSLHTRTTSDAPWFVAVLGIGAIAAIGLASMWLRAR
ncbi:MAG: hypothetical protein HY868_03235 [Chloroflexi bacterium]|nr:hypothetical protein [Chloroflexota bacterium]